MDKFLGFKTEEILTCLLLVVVGYFIAKMFSGCGCANRVDGFSVGGEIVYCNPTLKDPPQKCPGNIDCPKYKTINKPSNHTKRWSYNQSR